MLDGGRNCWFVVDLFWQYVVAQAKGEKLFEFANKLTGCITVRCVVLSGNSTMTLRILDVECLANDDSKSDFPCLEDLQYHRLTSASIK